MRSYPEAAARVIASVRNADIASLKEFLAEIMHNAARTQNDTVGYNMLKALWRTSSVPVSFDNSWARLLAAGVLTSVPVAGRHAERQYRLSSHATMLASVVHQRRTSGLRHLRVLEVVPGAAN